MDGNPDLSALGVDPSQAAAYQALEANASKRALFTALLGGLAAGSQGQRRGSLGRALGAAGRSYDAARTQAINEPLAIVQAAQQQKRQALLDQATAEDIKVKNAKLAEEAALLPGRLAESVTNQLKARYEPQREQLETQHTQTQIQTSQENAQSNRMRANASMANYQLNQSYKGLHVRFDKDANGNTYGQSYRINPDGTTEMIGSPALVYSPSKDESTTTSTGDINWGGYRKGAEKAFNDEFKTYRANIIAKEKAKTAGLGGVADPNFKPPSMGDFMQSPAGRAAFRRATGKDMPSVTQKVYPTAPEGYSMQSDPSTGANLNANDDPRLGTLPRGVPIPLSDGRTMIIDNDGNIAISNDPNALPSTSVAPAGAGPGVPMS